MIRSFKNLIGDGKRYLTKKTAPDKETLFYIFKEVVQEYFGKIGSEKLMPDYFSNGVLFIKSQNSVWSSELWINKAEITRKINKKIGESLLKEIKIKNH
jgi:hypothetical protein